MTDQRKLRSTVVSISCVSATLILAACTLGLSQGTSPVAGLDTEVHLSLSKATLLDVMKELSGKYNVSSVADGEPIAAPMDVRFDGRLRDGLDAMAEHFDMKWLDRNGAILFQKRFRDPKERPQTHPKEIRQSVKDILSVLPSVPAAENHDTWSSALKRFAQTLSPVQVDALKSGALLRVDALGPEQAELVRQAILIRGYGIPRGVWERLHKVLDNLSESSIAPNALGDNRGSGIVHTILPKGQPPITVFIHAADRQGRK